jgi:hypothetical protein
VGRPHSRLLVPAMLRPFAEHLVALLRPSSGDLCVEVAADTGVMSTLLARTGATCIAADDDADALADLRDEAAMVHLGNLHTVRAPSAALPLPDGAAQVVTSLFTLTDEPDPAATLGEMLRILDPRQGRLACALWTEGAVRLGRRLGPAWAAALRAPLELVAIRDLARFDGVEHLRAALGEATDDDDLRPHAAADGTLRIPTTAVVLLASR